MRLQKVVVQILITLFLTMASVSFANECDLTGERLVQQLSLEFWDFDQTALGWRQVADSGCYFESAQLIDIYHLQHSEKLLLWQRRILFWHAGQMYAFSGFLPLAIMRFEKSINPDEEPNPELRWNDYVRGSIAFLNKDLETLKISAERAAISKHDNNLKNVAILKSMIACFDRTYKEAYSASCGR